jgi:hypothetical protein
MGWREYKPKRTSPDWLLGHSVLVLLGISAARRGIYIPPPPRTPVSQSTIFPSVLHIHSPIIRRRDSGPVRGCRPMPQTSSLTPRQKSKIKIIKYSRCDDDEWPVFKKGSKCSFIYEEPSKSLCIITRYVPTTDLYRPEKTSHLIAKTYAPAQYQYCVG